MQELISEKVFSGIKMDIRGPLHRREMIIMEMEKLKKRNIHCLSCSGICCTSVANSMLITPFEAVELYSYLNDEGRINGELLSGLRKNIEEFRLDKDFTQGKGSSLRKNYTCPFYKKGSKGCSIDPAAKPYGCLGFNPMEGQLIGDGGCESNIVILKKRATFFLKDEELVNDRLKKQFNLWWDKRAIPLALLDLHRVLSMKEGK